MYFNKIRGNKGKLILIEIYNQDLELTNRIFADDFKPEMIKDLSEIIPSDRITIRNTRPLNSKWNLLLELPEYTSEQLDSICKNINCKWWQKGYTVVWCSLDNKIRWRTTSRLKEETKINSIYRLTMDICINYQ